jgi:hypothetical protein
MRVESTNGGDVVSTHNLYNGRYREKVFKARANTPTPESVDSTSNGKTLSSPYNRRQVAHPCMRKN